MPKITLLQTAILAREGTKENAEHQAGTTHDVSDHVAERLIRLGVAESGKGSGPTDDEKVAAEKAKEEAAAKKAAAAEAAKAEKAAAAQAKKDATAAAKAAKAAAKS